MVGQRRARGTMGPGEHQARLRTFEAGRHHSKLTEFLGLPIARREDSSVVRHV